MEAYMVRAVYDMLDEEWTTTEDAASLSDNDINRTKDTLRKTVAQFSEGTALIKRYEIWNGRTLVRVDQVA